MFWYVGLSWNPADPHQQAVAERLKTLILMAHGADVSIVETTGLSVYFQLSSPHAAYVLDREGGVVLGLLFSNSGAPITEAPLSVTPRSLVTRYWGAYVAFIRDPHAQTHAIEVLRDPSGKIPCLVGHIEQVAVYFLRFADFQRLRPPPLTINTDFIAGRLAYWSVNRRDTGLNGISTLMAGESMARDQNSVSRAFPWNPLQIARTAPVENVSEATNTLFNGTMLAVRTWASCFETILHHLSGGLDSSIVLACLRYPPSPTRTVCLNKFFEFPLSDERKFARLAASHFGAPLCESPLAACWSLDLMDKLPPSPCPLLWIGITEQFQEDCQCARSWGAHALFDGHGGDEIFFTGADIPASADLIYARRSIRLIWQTLLNDSSLEHQSIGRTARRALRHGLSKRPWNPRDIYCNVNQPLIPPEVKEAALGSKELVHPLFRDTANTPPAKFLHAFFISQHTCRLFNPCIPTDVVASVSPLISQPLMEACLRIPTHLLLANGRSRAIARRAFAHLLPSQILKRSWKGTSDALIKFALHKQRPQIRDYLLGGYLAEHHLIDRVAVDACLSGEVTTKDFEYHQFLDFLTIESWARSVR